MESSESSHSHLMTSGNITINECNSCDSSSYYMADNTTNIIYISSSGTNYTYNNDVYTSDTTSVNPFVYETLDIIADEEIYTLKIMNDDIYLYIKETDDIVTSGQTEVLEYLKPKVTQTQFLFIQRFIFEKMI